MGFPVVFEEAVFALEAAFGSGEITLDQFVLLDFFGVPIVDGRFDVVVEEVIEFDLGAAALPFGLGGFEDEGIEDGGFDGVLVFVQPGFKELVPGVFVFVGEDEGFGTESMGGCVAGGFGSAFRGGRAGVAAVAFWALGVDWAGF